MDGRISSSPCEKISFHHIFVHCQNKANRNRWCNVCVCVSSVRLWASVCVRFGTKKQMRAKCSNEKWRIHNTVILQCNRKMKRQKDGYSSLSGSLRNQLHVCLHTLTHAHTHAHTHIVSLKWISRTLSLDTSVVLCSVALLLLLLLLAAGYYYCLVLEKKCNENHIIFVCGQLKILHSIV